MGFVLVLACHEWTSFVGIQHGRVILKGGYQGEVTRRHL